jgi:hypothetical protein
VHGGLVLPIDARIVAQIVEDFVALWREPLRPPAPETRP